MLQEIQVDGHKLSPILEEGKKNYLIDIDGTICDDIPNEEPWRMVEATVYDGALTFVNSLYEQGHIVTFFTSRTDAHKEITVTWLKLHGFKYHYLLLNKPRGGNYHWVDNHLVMASKFEGSFENLIGTDI